MTYHEALGFRFVPKGSKIVAKVNACGYSRVALKHDCYAVDLPGGEEIVIIPAFMVQAALIDSGEGDK